MADFNSADYFAIDYYLIINKALRKVSNLFKKISTLFYDFIFTN